MADGISPSGVTPEDPKNNTTVAPPEPKVEPKPDEGVADFEKLKAALHKANKEAEKSRLENKELKGKLDSLAKALSPGGSNPSELTPEVAQARLKESEAKQTRILLRSAFVGMVARDVHDAEAAFEVVQRKLTDVKVDLSAETVDTEALKEKVDDFKKSHPFFFVPQGTGNSGASNPVNPPPDSRSGGQPSGSNPYADWQNLLKQGRKNEANEFFSKNRLAIYANWK